MMVSSCGNKKNNDADPSVYIPAQERTFDHEDSLEVNRLVDEYVASMANHNIDSCMRMLYFVKNDSVFPLGAEQQKEFKDAWTKLHIYGVKKKGFLLRSAKNNDITILLQIVPSGDLDKEIGVTAQHINPVFKEGQWYLTLLDLNAEGVYDVFDESNTNGNVEFIKQ